MTWADYYRELDILRSGGYTGWHDETGAYAPHPPDFYLEDGTINPHWQPAAGPTPDPITSPDEQPH
jgi:hypothetical protein